MKKRWLFLLLVGLVGITSVCLLACGRQCTGTADCTSECLGWDFESERWCSDTVAVPDAGKVCKNAENGTCDDDDQVLCGLARWRKCDPNAAPNCSPPHENTDNIYMAGCV